MMGRFISPDPAGRAVADPANPQSWNQYSYVQNSPMSAVDPSGMACYPLEQRITGGCGPQEGVTFGSSWNEFEAMQIPVMGWSFVLPKPIYTPFPVAPPYEVSISISYDVSSQWDWTTVGQGIDVFNSKLQSNANAGLEGDPIVGLDPWKGRQQLWSNTAGVGNAAVAATGALVAAPVVAEAASSLTFGRLAIGPGQPYGIHVAIGMGATWLHWIQDAVDEFGNIRPAITTEAAEAWAMRAAWFRIPIPLLNSAGVLGTAGQPASNCLTAVCYAIGQGWIR
jgi:hypothetical protein